MQIWNVARWCYNNSMRLREEIDLVPPYIDHTNDFHFNFTHFDYMKREDEIR